MSEDWRIGEDKSDPGFDVIIQHDEDRQKTRQIEQRKQDQKQRESHEKKEQEQPPKE